MDLIAQPLSQTLFEITGKAVYAILDGASIPDLRMKLYKLRPEHVCLYRGELAPDMAEVAPYLVRLLPNGEFTNWILAEGIGKHWGIFAQSDARLPEAQKHFRMLLTVYDPSGKPMLFRFYDPRVLRVYLPTCNEAELKTFYGPVSGYLIEDEDPKLLLNCRDKEGKLNITRTEITAEKA